MQEVKGAGNTQVGRETRNAAMTAVQSQHSISIQFRSQWGKGVRPQLRK